MRCYCASVSELILMIHLQLQYVKRIVPWAIFQELFLQCDMFLGKPESSISCKVTGPRRYSHDLPQGGMEIPCTIEFKGDEINVNKLKWIIAQQKENREACVSHVQTEIKEEESGSPSTTSTVGVALKESIMLQFKLK